MREFLILAIAFNLNTFSILAQDISEIVIEAVGKRSRIPRWELFNRVSDVVQRRFGYSVRREAAIGDHSVIYTADAPGDKVIVKAHVRQLFADDRRQDLTEIPSELETAKALKHPAFIRLFDWALDTDPQIMVTEFVYARQLGQIVTSPEQRLDVDQVRFIIQVIAEALAEYHKVNLVYDNIRPSDVLLEKRDDGTLYPRISAFRASQISHKLERVTRKFEINPERLTYVVPEQYEKDMATPKTDQYALGLLTIEMLQGSPPVQVNQLKDLAEKTKFFEDPEAYGGEWLKRSPTLTRITLKMLELNPDKRWQSMAALAAVLGGKATVMENNRRLAKESYKRLEYEQEAFFREFYTNLFIRKRSLKSKFPDEHDWKRQHSMLDDAVRGLLNFSETHGEEEPTIFTDTAKKHKNLKLSKEDFDAFEEAFIETLKKFNEGSEEMLGAWRACFEPGMSYMKKHATLARVKRPS